MNENTIHSHVENGNVFKIMESATLYLFISGVIIAVGYIPFKILLHISRNNKKHNKEED